MWSNLDNTVLKILKSYIFFQNLISSGNVALIDTMGCSAL